MLRKLSKGGMGEVYLAKSGQISGFEKLVVIKRILPHLSSDKEFSKRFIREANIAIKLSHVNIVPVLEVGKVSGEFFLSLEHVEGKDLRALQSLSYQNKEVLPIHLSLLIVRDLLTGLSYAHRKQDLTGKNLHIVHCDISPPNVLISYEGEVKIIDFGIAKSVIHSDEDDNKMGFGKFGYMAPEQIINGGIIDTKTDLYSAGVIMWELLTGEKMIVFKKDTPFKKIAKKIVVDEVKKPSFFNPDVSPEVDLIVMKAISKNKDERFQSASAFRDAVQLALVNLAPTVSNETLGEYIKNKFKAKLDEEKEILREAKELDINNYQMELTTAMEKTVSFAMGDDWRSMTGPIQSKPLISDSAPSPPEPSPQPSSDSPPFPPPYQDIAQAPVLQKAQSEPVQKQSPVQKFKYLYMIGAASLILLTGIGLYSLSAFSSSESGEFAFEELFKNPLQQLKETNAHISQLKEEIAKLDQQNTRLKEQKKITEVIENNTKKQKTKPKTIKHKRNYG
ncbi:MAG: serine/threonine-protein kinase, partial [Deltaproteobacteria bacterium]|nr:serine/threonine-protein kinase [Deltaproteobacteria bacterium]